MIDLMQITTWAQSVPDHSPVAEAAKAVCLVRQRSPYDWVAGPFGSLPMWQGIIIEAAILDRLGRMV